MVSMLFLLVFIYNNESSSKPPLPPDPTPPTGNVFNIGNQFSPSGWMGDGEVGGIKLDKSCRINPHSPDDCMKIVYTPGPRGWAGIYWQNKANNWGDYPGENFSKSEYKEVSFWARGEKGTEKVEFKAGGINAQGKHYKDSFEVSIEVTLEKNWKQYSIPLAGKDLSNVIGGFCWVASNGLTFYIDDIELK